RIVTAPASPSRYARVTALLLPPPDRIGVRWADEDGMSDTKQLGLIATRPSPGVRGSRVLLVGGFQMVEGDAHVALAEGSQRLLALLALRGRPVKRLLVAGTLWPDVTEGRAYASLRSALSRLYGSVREAVEVSPSDIRLASSVRVDLRESQALAHRLLDA